MVGNVVPKQRRENTVPPPPASKAAPLTRRAVECSKKKAGVGLADLRDVDKAKVARLINHVMVAFKEIQRLKELLELERSTQAARVTKLQQQNHEVAAELRLKLASLQLLSPLPAQKVYLHAGRRPSLSPIREAECSEAESEVPRSLAPESKTDTKSILRERENHISDFTTTAGGGKGIFSKSEEGTGQLDENDPMGEFQASYSQANVFESQGKENKDPEFLPQSTGDTQMANEEDAATVLRKRPPPRPLPDLLSNILHRCKDFGVGPSADQSKSSVKSIPQGDALNGSLPVLQGNLKPIALQRPPQPALASRSSFSLDLESVKQLSTVATSSGQVLTDLSTGSCSGDRLGCTYHGPCLESAASPLATVQQCHAKTSVDLDGHEYTTRLESGGKDMLGRKCLEGGRQCEALTCVVHTHCKCTAIHPCLSNCQERQSSNLTNTMCPEVLERPEKVRNETFIHEDLIGTQTTTTSQKKLRFDPTAGEEGVFYYVSDIEKNASANLDMESLHSIAPGERQGVQMVGSAERVMSSMSSIEGQRQERDTRESHWTPEAIERRNSFHRIPVISPRSMNDNEGHADEQKRLFPDGVGTQKMENEAGREVPSSSQQEQLPTSESEVVSITNEKSYSPKSRRSSQRTSKCINFSSIVPRTPRRAPLSSNKIFANCPPRCSKCSSILERKSSLHRVRGNETGRGTMKKSHICSSKAKPGRQSLWSSVQTHDSGTEDKFHLPDPTTPSSSGNMARCVGCTTRFKPRPLPQKPRRGPVRMRSYVPVDAEGSDPSSVVYCVASEDMYMSTNSSTDYCIKARRRVPSFPLKVCRIHTRKIKKKRSSGRVMTSVKLLSDQSSEPAHEVFHLNREILDMSLQSDGKNAGQVRPPRADSTECRIETWRFEKSHKAPCKESTEERLEQRSKASSGGVSLHGQLDIDLDPRRRLTVRCEGRQRSRPYDHVRGRKQSSDTWKKFEVDDLLDRFIQSNAECAAELIKCSVYFESTSSRSSSQSTLVSEKASDDYTASKLPFQNTEAVEHGTEGCIVSPERVQPRRELFRVDQNRSGSAQPCSEESVRCSRCGVFIKPRPIDMVDTMDLRDLCDTCSASVTPEKIKAVRRSTDHEPDETRPSANIAPPIVLPRVNSGDKCQIDEAERPQKSFVPPCTSEILICNLKKSGDWASEAPHYTPDLSSGRHRMPIITGVSVSSRRSTPPRELDEADPAKDLTEMFDMSLYDLVNDLEGQRRDYWRRVNSHTIDERPRNGNQDPNRRRMVDVENVRRSSTTRRLLPRKQVHANHFR